MSEELIRKAENLVRRGAAGGNPVAEFGVTKEIAFVRGVRYALEAKAETDEAKLTELREALEQAEQSASWAYGDDWTPQARKAHNALRNALADYLRGER